MCKIIFVHKIHWNCVNGTLNISAGVYPLQPLVTNLKLFTILNYLLKWDCDGYLFLFFNVNKHYHISIPKITVSCLLCTSALKAITAIGEVVAWADKLTVAVRTKTCFLVCLGLSLHAMDHRVSHLSCQ